MNIEEEFIQTDSEEKKQTAPLEVNVRIMRLHPDAVIPPRQAYRGDACFDLTAVEDTLIPAGKSHLVPVGFALEVSEDWEIILRPRSHQSYSTYLPQLATLDSNFRGDVGPMLHNFTREDFLVRKGDRICQMAIRPVPKVHFIVTDNLNESERGTKGFGSSGR